MVLTHRAVWVQKLKTADSTVFQADRTSLCLVSAAEVCTLFCAGGGETPTEGALPQTQRGKTPGESAGQPPPMIVMNENIVWRPF